MTTNKKIVILATIILVVAVLLSSFFYINYQRPYSGAIEPVTVGIFVNDVNSLIYIANDQQYFTNNGLNVTLREYTSGLESLNGMLRGESNISTATEFVLAAKAVENSSIYTFASECKASSIFMIGRIDRGINTISDLKGKTIGVAIGTNGQFYLGRFLELNNINESEVTVINVPFDQSLSALANGTVDAIIPPQPYVNEIESSLGSNIVMWPAQGNQLFYFDLICARDWGATHTELIVRFLRALVQAEDFHINHEDQARAMIAKRLNYTDAYTAAVWPDFQFLVSLDQSQILAMQDETRWLISNNLTNATAVPDFLNYIYVDGLKVVKPSSVNIIG